MVDSSIGGKTGVDHGGKNKTGSIYQPRLVIADPEVLKTLDERVYREGFGEIVKYAILDAGLLPTLEKSVSTLHTFDGSNVDTLGKIIAHCVKQKSDVIRDDPFEKAPLGRVLLNYGHTLGHGLEAGGGYEGLFHGEAVAIGMNYAAQLAVRLDHAEDSLVEKQRKLLERFDLPVKYDGKASLDDIMRHIAKDKKNDSGATTRFVLPLEAGKFVVEQVTNDVVRETVEQFLATGTIFR